MKWPRVTLGTVSSLITKGTTPKTLGRSYVVSGVPFLRAENLQGGEIVIDKKTLYIDEETDSHLTRSRILPGDVLLSIAGTIGRAAIVPLNSLKMNCNQAVAILRITDKLDNRFLLHWLKSEDAQSQILRSKVTATISNLSLGQINKLKVPLPPLPIQKKIANILEKTNEVLRKRQESLCLMDQFPRSAFLQMFGDPAKNPRNLRICKLREVANVIMGQSPESGSYNSEGVGIPLLNGPIEFGDTHPRELQWTTQPTKVVQKGDILFCVRGATAGRMNWADKQYCIGRGLAAIRPKESELLSSRFLFAVLKIRYSYFQRIGQGSTFININKEMLEDLSLPIPEIADNDRFVTLIERSREILQKQRQTIPQLNILSQFLMQKAFKGELVY